MAVQRRSAWPSDRCKVLLKLMTESRAGPCLEIYLVAMAKSLSSEEGGHIVDDNMMIAKLNPS